MKLLQCYIITVCLFFALSCASVNLQNSAQDCDLECWLANLTIVIPPQSVIQSGFNLSVANMKVDCLFNLLKYSRNKFCDVRDHD